MIIASLLAVIELQAGFLGGYAYASFLESYFHEHINDAPKRRVDRWRRQSCLFQPLIRINFTHHIVHHAKTYRRDHVTQFQSVAEKAALDGELNKTVHGRKAIEGHYGLTFLPLRRVVTALPLVAAVMLCYFLFGAWATVGAAVAVSLPAFLANRVHPYLHMPHELAVREASGPISLLLRTRYMQAVARHHFLHHRYGQYNFNLLLGGDWIRGKVRRASASDIVEMQRIGLQVQAEPTGEQRTTHRLQASRPGAARDHAQARPTTERS